MPLAAPLCKVSTLPLADDSARLAALARYRILDTAPQSGFDNLAYLSARICGASMAYIAFLDDRREWCKARLGWPNQESPREFSLYGTVLGQASMLVVSDARADARFARHPWVQSERKVRFFACVPLLTPDDFAIGSLTVADHEARHLSPAQVEGLKALAREIMNLLEQRREAVPEPPAASVLQPSRPRLHALPASAPAPASPAGAGDDRLGWLIQQAPIAMARLAPDGRFLDVNPAWCELLGYEPAEAAALSLADIVQPEDLSRLREHMLRLLQGEIAHFSFEQRYTRKNRGAVWVRSRTLLLSPGGGPPEHLVLAEDINERKRAENEVRLLQGMILAAGGASDLNGALRIALYQICEATQWDLGQAWVPTPAGHELQLSSAYYGREPGLERFRYLQAGSLFARGEGLLGRAWALKQPQWSRDVLAQADFRRGGAAQECGLHACMAVPIAVHDEIVAVLELFAREPREPERRLLRVAGTVAAQLGVTLRRRQAEDQIRRQDARLRLLMEQMPVALWTTDADLRFTSLHGAGLVGLGVRAEELVGASLHSVFAEDDEEEAGVIAAHRRALQGEALGCDMAWNGRHWHAYLEPLRDAAGAIAGIAAMALDVSGVHAAETALRESEDHYRVVAESAAEGIVSTNDAGTVVFANAAAGQIFGFEREALLGRKIDALIPDFFARIRQTPHPDHAFLELEGAPRGGRALQLEVAIAESFRRGRRLHTALIRDITEKRQLEEQLRQAQKMDAIGRLAGGIAHDFNNLLTIMEAERLALKQALAEDSPLQAHLEQMERTGEHGASLTRQLLAFGRRQVLKPQALDLNAVVTRMHGMLRHLIGEDIELRTDLAATLPHVKVDPGQMQQVILNLVVNARDAMPHGGHLTLETREVQLEETDDQGGAGVASGRYVMVALHDTGVGMDAHTMTHVFEPFFSTKGPERNSGLGLATVYGIVQQSGGHVVVASAPGEGASFRIYLPRAQAEVVVLPAAPALAPPAYGTETIVLVEDYAPLRQTMRDVLMHHGYTVLEARHGEEALVLCSHHPQPIDLLVTDVVMPRLSGHELARRLREVHPSIKVLYISGYAENSLPFPGSPASAKGLLLAKPFPPDRLAQRVRAALDTGLDRPTQLA